MPGEFLYSKPQNPDHLNLFERAVIVGIIVSLALQMYLQFTQKINWDEFYYLAQVYDYQRGGLSQPLQTFQVYLFGWLPLVGGTEIEKIIVARIFMWLFESATLFFVYSIARAFVSRNASLIAVLAYISSGAVLIHGTSFRADPMAAFAMMFCLYVLIRLPLSFKNLFGFSVVAAVAALITVKIIFFAPALIGAALWRITSGPDPYKTLTRLALSAVATVVWFGLLYWYHLSTMPLADTAVAQAKMSSAFTTTLLSEGLFPRLDAMRQGLNLARIQGLLLFLGTGVALLDFARQKVKTPTLIMLFVLASPLLSLIFYRNAFPYFLAFIFPSSMVLAGYFVDRIKDMRLATAALCLLMVAGAFSVTLSRESENMAVQRNTIEMVHRIFKQPVNYIDRNSMISSFPKQGFFMSGWGYRNYLKKGEAIYAQVLKDKVTPLLIINSLLLENALGQNSPLSNASLLQRDVEVLRENFIPHWGFLWVAGKKIAADITPQNFSVLTPGTYSVEVDNVVEIDGKIYVPGSTLNLARGDHSVSAQAATTLTLRWGGNLYRPDTPAPSKPLFTGF